MKEVDKKVFDRRVVERNVRKGVVKHAEYQSYLKSLPDETNNAQWVQLDLHDSELGEMAPIPNGDGGGDHEGS